MYFPQFVVGMFVTSFVVTIWTGVSTGSGWVADMSSGSFT
jgi:hypothetical protein